MKICLLTAGLSRAAGGLGQAIPGLVAALAREPGCSVVVGGAIDPSHPDDWRTWGPSVHAHQRYGPASFAWAPGLPEVLRRLMPDVIDTQGLWTYASLACLSYARRTGTPHVVTPHGMLDPWAFRRSWWKKRIVRAWFEDAHLRQASALHALCRSEAESIRALGLRNPIAVVPNGVDLPPPVPGPVGADGPRKMLFLGRIDRKKGVRELLQAWSQVEREARATGWTLQITGWGAPDYVAAMQAVARDLGLAPSSVAFTGPLFGDAKEEALRDAAAFILPSFSEGLPMAVLEAWSHALPVLMTDMCNLPEGFAAGAARRIEPRPEAIADGIRNIMLMDEQARAAIGQAGRTLVGERFTWPKVAAEMHAVYGWVVGGGAPPYCVVTD